jgi:hypothetical protein
MPILETDIKLMASERMYDEDDGGGRMTGNEIVDGVSNNMFPDVSQLDRTYGRLNLRKVFPAVLSADTDTYFGTHLVVSEPPSDDDIHVTLMRVSNAVSAWVDERTDAQDKIESYITTGPLSPMRLLGDHYEGQMALLAYQQTTDPLPSVGDVYALVDDGDNKRQYVRISAVSSSEVIYYDASGSFVRTELLLTISDPLITDFPGGVPHRESSYQPATTINRTNAIPAVSYYGVQPLAEAAAFGAYEVKAASYKDHLLPATQAEEPLLDVNAGNAMSFEVVSVSGGRTVTISQVENTSIVEVGVGNRGYTYVTQLEPKPAPGTLSVAYRAQEKWYHLADVSGDGQLTGDGSGSVTYTTGSVSLTLAEMPDVDTRIIFGWGSGDDLERRDDAVVEKPQYRHTVEHTPIKASSVTITWESSGVTKTMTDDGAGGLSGDGTGFVIYSAGELVFTPTELPDPAAIPHVQYTQQAKTVETFTNVTPDSGTGEATVTLANQPVSGSVKARFNTRRTKYFLTRVNRDARYDPPRAGISEAAWDGSAYPVTIDTPESDICVVDVPNKMVTIKNMLHYYYRYRWKKTYKSGGVIYKVKYKWSTADTYTLPIATDVIVEYAIAGAAETVYDETIPAQNLVVDLTADTMKAVYPNSVRFQLAGHTYENIEGEMHRDIDPQTGVGTVSGSIDYLTGLVTLTDWIAGSADITISSLLVENNPWQANYISSYAAVAPVRPGSFTVAATALDGELLTATAAATGEISGSYIRGTIDVETGIFDLDFGENVLDSSLSAEDKAEDWYDPAEVDGDGYIWKPRTVWPATVRYNCVAYVYMPLSADILGIDPVRLPMDGRVPIYRVGDVVVIHHTQETSIASPTDGQLIDTGRVRLAWAKLYDANGDPVPTANYTTDLDAGTVTLDDVSGLATPLLLKDRIEDMALVNDVQINGTLTLTRALSHDFPSDSLVSSALIMGDLFARVTNVYEQSTWTGAWSDDLIGDAPLASYNNTVYPITVTNHGATQERWAIIFTSSTAFRVVGEFSGQIAVGDVNSDCSPLNPATGEPYFIIQSPGWGSGWSTGNVLRFNTIAANKPIWIARTILQSESASGSDHFCIEVRGDVDTP